MIYNYEIKNDILYVYLDFDDEFAKLNWKDKKQKLEDNIKNFINENKINFKGTKVAIVVGGILLGTLVLGISNNKYQTDSPNSNIMISENILDNKLNTNIEEVENGVSTGNETTNISIKDSNEHTNISQIVEKNEQITTNETVNTNQNVNIQTLNKEQNQQQTNVVVNNQSLNVIEQPNNNIAVENNQSNVSTEIQIEEQKTYVTIKRTNGQIINLELEEYLIGVVGAEMPAAFHEQALMSQAVIARTYALKAINRGITLTDNSSTQNYKSNNELQVLWGSDYNYYYTKIKNAVEATKGMYLTYNGTLIDAVYHSTSNGTTEDSRYVWGNYFPYLVSVESVYDSSNPSFIKEQFISYQELTQKLEIDININTNFNILSRTSGNRILNIEINGITYTGVQIRNLLGLRSTDFEITKTDTGITFVTKGYGHGVGLSQYGANGMAKAGYNYEQILKHYYCGITINQM